MHAGLIIINYFVVHVFNTKKITAINGLYLKIVFCISALDKMFLKIAGKPHVEKNIQNSVVSQQLIISS